MIVSWNSRLPLVLSCIAAALGSLFSPSFSLASEFIPLDGISARVISGDGLTVYGKEITASNLLQSGLAKWTQAAGVVVVDDFQQFYGGTIESTSSDGTYIIGSDGPTGDVRPYIWSAASGFTYLDSYSASSIDFPRGVSDDGQTIVGYNFSPCCEGLQWGADGSVSSLGIATPLPPQLISNYGAVFSLSADGGAMSLQTSDGAYLRIGSTDNFIHPTSDIQSFSKVSSDGLFVVGRFNGEAYRYSVQSGFETLGVLPQYIESRALDVSAGGRVVVGYCEDANLETEAFIWTQSGGMQSLKEWLLMDGEDVDAWELNRLTAISDNGQWVVGAGLNPDGDFQSFVVHLGDPYRVPTLSGGAVFALALLLILLNLQVRGTLRNY